MDNSTFVISRGEFVVSSDIPNEDPNCDGNYLSSENYLLQHSNPLLTNSSKESPSFDDGYSDYAKLSVLIGLGSALSSGYNSQLKTIVSRRYHANEKPHNINSWFKYDWVQVKKIILNFNNLIKHATNPLPYQHFEWSLQQDTYQPTDLNLSPSFKIDDAAIQFIKESQLPESIMWLQEAAPKYFEGADFEINMLQNEDGEDNLLALKVYGAFSVLGFRNRRHSICAEMLAAKHKSLYEIISIFQRRVDGCGWKTFSWYGTISEK